MSINFSFNMYDSFPMRSPLKSVTKCKMMLKSNENSEKMMLNTRMGVLFVGKLQM